MLKQHPLSAAFPAMGADDFAALVEDIRANGQREPVTVLDGMVLDGWHRYQACQQLGMEAQKFTFPSDKDPVAFVLSENLHRRHLTPSQRAAAVVACSDYGGKGRPAKMGKVAHLTPAPTVPELAKAAQVAPRLIKDAAVAKKAGLLDEVKDGTISASKAAEIARGKPEPKPSKREMPKPPEPANDDQLAEAQHTITDLAQEVEQLRDRLAVESLMDSEEAKTQTAETISELRSRVKALEAEVDALKVSRDTYMREATEAKKSAIYWRKQAEKAA
jgi:ParB-like chromosome segregation protein Spo0J